MDTEGRLSALMHRRWDNSIWLGAKIVSSDIGFAWLSDKRSIPDDADRWAEGQPSGSDNSEDQQEACLGTWGQDETPRWYDFSCAAKLHFICEKTHDHDDPAAPSAAPSEQPTSTPTSSALSSAPSVAPTSSAPSSAPSMAPSNLPTLVPSSQPTAHGTWQ